MNNSRVKQTLIIAILVAVLLPLGGCLVNEDSDTRTTIYRTTDVVRPIVNGDFYDYRIVGNITNSGGGGSSQFVTGTLTVEYNDDNSLPQPFGGALYPDRVIREDTTLTLGGAVYTTKRYIQQNMDGSLQVLAAKSGTELYRTGPADNDTGNLQPIVFLTSPVPLTGDTNINFQYRQGCETLGDTTCASIITTINDTVVYRGNSTIDTDVGKFNSIVYESTGSISTTTPNIRLDFRGACSSSNATFYVQTYIFPEVGIVYYDYTCTAQDLSGLGYNFRAYLTNTNVPIPN